MAVENGFDPVRFWRHFGVHGHNGFLGLEYVTHTADHIEVKIPHREGFAEGAVIALLDSAATLAIWTKSGRFRPHATVDLRIDHLAAPPSNTEIIARAECYSLEDKVAYVRATARTGEGLTVAVSTAIHLFTDVT